MDKIEKIEKTAENKVKFTFNDKADREFPLIIAMMPVLPKHAIDVATFDQSTLTPPVGSGPYLVDSVEPGTRIVYRRNPDYWAKDLPSKRGFDNYDKITVEYFRDQTALFEAFKKGLYDVYPEGDPTQWETAYDFPAVKEGKVKKAAFVSNKPQSMLGFFFNTRREQFADRNVRQALAMLFDFEWVNRNLFSGRYTRTESFWQNSDELSAIGRPADAREKALLAPFPDAVLPSVMDGTYHPEKTNGSGRDRNVLRAALKKLMEAGYSIQDGKLMKDGKQLAFEIMTSGLGEEKMALAYKRTAGALGIDVSVRTVDDAQFQARRQSYDYDMTAATLSASLSPGAEQIWRWGSQSRDVEGTFNYAGASDPAIDAMIEALINAREREDFAAAVRALDRILISGQYVIPLYHIRRILGRLLGSPEIPGKDAALRLPVPGMVVGTNDRDPHRHHLRRDVPLVFHRQEAVREGAGGNSIRRSPSRSSGAPSSSIRRCRPKARIAIPIWRRSSADWSAQRRFTATSRRRAPWKASRSASMRSGSRPTRSTPIA